MKNLVSVTLLVRDSGPILDEFMKRLKAQNVDFSYELVVLYFGKGSKTLKKLGRATSRIVRIRPEEFDCGTTRDLVCSVARGEYIITLSLDSLPYNDSWLQEIVSPMILGKADIVQGEIMCPKNDDLNYPNFFYWEKDYRFYFTTEGSEFYKQYGNLGLSCVNLAFKKSVWEKAKFSGVSYCEDKIFQKKAFELGFKIRYNTKAIVLHAHSYSTIKSLFKRCSNEGIGWKELDVAYPVTSLIRDMFQLNLHYQAVIALLTGKLHYSSELFFFFIRPLSLYWGNKFAKSVYS